MQKLVQSIQGVLESKAIRALDNARDLLKIDIERVCQFMYSNFLSIKQALEKENKKLKEEIKKLKAEKNATKREKKDLEKAKA